MKKRALVVLLLSIPISVMAVNTPAKVNKEKILAIIQGASSNSYTPSSEEEEQVEITIPATPTAKKGERKDSPFSAKKTSELSSIPVPNLKKGSIGVPPGDNGMIKEMAKQGVFVNPLYFQRGKDSNDERRERDNNVNMNGADIFTATRMVIPQNSTLPNLPPENIILENGGKDYYRSEIINDDAVTKMAQITKERKVSRSHSSDDLLLESLR